MHIHVSMYHLSGVKYMPAFQALSIIDAMYITDDYGNLVMCKWGQVFVFACPEL